MSSLIITKTNTRWRIELPSFCLRSSLQFVKAIVGSDHVHVFKEPLVLGTGAVTVAQGEMMLRCLLQQFEALNKLGYAVYGFDCADIVVCGEACFMWNVERLAPLDNGMFRVNKLLKRTAFFNAEAMRVLPCDVAAKQNQSFILQMFVKTVVPLLPQGTRLWYTMQRALTNADDMWLL